MELVKKLSKNGTIIILLHLGIKANRKVQNSLRTFGNWKEIASYTKSVGIYLQELALTTVAQGNAIYV